MTSVSTCLLCYNPRVPVIAVHALSKTFQLKVKAAGLKGSFAALARPAYRSIEAVRGISFDIDEGELVAFIGPNESRGNLGVGTFRRGGIHNLNAAMSRTWTLAPEKSLTFRAESINLLNTPQFADPVTDLTSPSFGQITNTLNEGRTFQFQLRFRF